MASGGFEETSDEIFNFKCTPCARINRHREAVKYCVECQGYCCQACVDTHQKFPTLMGHKLLDKSTGYSADFPVVPTELCSIHKIKILGMYCGAHDVIGCTSCMTLEHRSCTDVHLISDVVDNMFKKTEVDELQLKLQEKRTTIEQNKISREALLEELNESKTSAVNSIKAFRKEMETLLQKLETKSIEEVDKEFNTMKAMLMEGITKYENQMQSLQQSVTDMKQSDGNIAQRFVYFKSAQKRISQTEDVLNTSAAHVHAKVSFDADQTILEFLRQLKTLGTVIRNTVYSVKGTREMNTTMQKHSSSCRLFGSCLTEDHKLLLPDYNNKKLKRVDIVKLSIVDYCDLPHNPIDVCCTDKQEAVVSLDNSTIQFVSLGNKMALTRDIKLGHVCFCIAYKDDKLYISDNSMSLYVHDMAGNLLQTISKDSSGKDLFGSSRHIAFSDFGDNIFISSGPPNSIVTLDGQGKHCNSFSDSDLSNATGVCTDRRGNLFVCGYSSNNILQLGQNGTKMGVVIKPSDGLNQPWSLAFDVRLGTLCVVQYNGTVKLFDLH